jgi:circadian clock protein KaiC
VVIIDPISNMRTAGNLGDSANMLVRLVDFLRKRRITGFLVSLTSAGTPAEMTDEGLSSVVDSWLLLRDVEADGERNRLIHVLKSRGMAHSNQVREFLISNQGVRLLDVYLGEGGVLTGSARLSREALEEAEQQDARDEKQRDQLAIEHRRRATLAQVRALQAGLRAEEEAFTRLNSNRERRLRALRSSREAVAHIRTFNTK